MLKDVVESKTTQIRTILLNFILLCCPTAIFCSCGSICIFYCPPPPLITKEEYIKQFASASTMGFIDAPYITGNNYFDFRIFATGINPDGEHTGDFEVNPGGLRMSRAILKDKMDVTVKIMGEVHKTMIDNINKKKWLIGSGLKIRYSLFFANSPAKENKRNIIDKYDYGSLITFGVGYNYFRGYNLKQLVSISKNVVTGEDETGEIWDATANGAEGEINIGLKIKKFTPFVFLRTGILNVQYGGSINEDMWVSGDVLTGGGFGFHYGSGPFRIAFGRNYNKVGVFTELNLGIDF